MSKKILQYLVIFLGILIILAFITLIYGMFLKIATKSKKISFDQKNLSLNLADEEKIVDIMVIDDNKLLIKVSKSSIIEGLIYNIEENKISNIITE